MFIVVSPAKKLAIVDRFTAQPTQPPMLQSATILAGLLKKESVDGIKKRMKLSDKLSQLNYERYQAFSVPFTEENSSVAVHTFAGDTYVGLDPKTLTDEDLKFAQQTLGILSGLYGILRPLDLMQPYRLEMGTKLPNPKGKDLYAFWGEEITKQITKMMEEKNTKVLVNLASKEYFSSVKASSLPGKVITPVFKEERNGVLKIISFSAKRARGEMARYIIQNRLSKPVSMKKFVGSGYQYQPQLSNETDWVFAR